MSGKKKSVGLALASMVAGIACMPVAAFISITGGMTLATLSVALVYMAG